MAKVTYYVDVVAGIQAGIEDLIVELNDDLVKLKDCLSTLKDGKELDKTQQAFLDQLVE